MPRLQDMKFQLGGIALAMFIASSAISQAAQAMTVVLPATADSIVLDGSSSVNPFPGLLASELGTTGAGSIWLSVLKFDLSSLAGQTVNSATLGLTTFFNHSSGTFSHQVFSSSDDSWIEATVNGLNRPSDSTLTLLSATNISGTSQTYTWNVLAGVNGTNGLLGPNHDLTLLVRPDLSQAGSVFGPHFRDRGATANFPQLILDVSPVPEPSSWMLLAAGLAIILDRKLAKRFLAVLADQNAPPGNLRATEA